MRTGTCCCLKWKNSGISGSHSVVGGILERETDRWIGMVSAVCCGKKKEVNVKSVDLLVDTHSCPHCGYN